MLLYTGGFIANEFFNIGHFYTKRSRRVFSTSVTSRAQTTFAFFVFLSDLSFSSREILERKTDCNSLLKFHIFALIAETECRRKEGETEWNIRTLEL